MINLSGGRHGTFNSDGWCSETRVGIQEKVVLEMPFIFYFNLSEYTIGYIFIV